MMATRPAWHYWVVSLICAAWNAMGAYDYLMTRARNLDYLNQATGGHAEIFLKWHESAGWLVQVGWPVGVWGSLLGALLLLARSRHAPTAYAVSLGGALVSYAAQLAGPFPPGIQRQGMAVAAVLIGTAIALQLWYARRAVARGLML